MTKLTEYTEVWPRLSDKAEEYMNDPNRVYPVPYSIRIEVEKVFGRY